MPRNGLDQPGELAGSLAESAAVTARAIRRRSSPSLRRVLRVSVLSLVN